ncbi:hypothetical protein IKQ26_00355 [bacterium]|nr:hypothetical protein [bacterium]
MKNLFKTSVDLIKYNSIFVQPIILLFIVLSFANGFILRVRGITIPFYALTLSIILLTIAVQSGWFYINSLAVKNADKEYKDKQERFVDVNQTFGKFFVGVGETFVKTLLADIIMLALFIGVCYCVFRWGMHHIGSPAVLFNMFNEVNMNPSQDMMTLAQKYYSPENTKIMLYWLGASWAVSNIFSFIFILYNGIIQLDKINPFKAIWKMVVFSLKSFFPLLLLFFMISVLNILLHIIVAISSINILLSALALLLMFLYINFIVFLILLYYERSKQKDNSDFRTELNREV